MSILGEMASLLHDVAELLRDTRELAEAVKNGRKYLAREHPEAKEDLNELLNQIRFTVVGLAKVTAVVTNFRFTTGDVYSASEASRFNGYVIAQKTLVAELHNNIHALKGSCDRIRDAHDRLNTLGADNRAGMFRLFSAERNAREYELANFMGIFYEHDQQMVDIVKRILNLSEQALTDANDTLGPSGSTYTSNVAVAASVLGIYAGAFRKSESELAALVETLDESISSLS